MHRYPILVILLAVILLWGWNFGRWDLRPPAETRYVQIAKELLHSDNWLNLTNNAQPYPDKPPLVFWIIASLMKLNNNSLNEWIVRLPFVVSALLILLLVYFLGKKIWDTRTGLISALILMTIPAFALEVPVVKLDILFTLFISFSFYIYLHTYLSGKRGNLWQWLEFWLSLALAVLTKGPLAVVIVLGTIIITAFWESDWQTVKSFHPLPGFILALIIVLAWFIPHSLTSEFTVVKNQLFYQNIVRLINFPKHREPYWYYFQQILFGRVSPWGVFLPFALYYIWKVKIHQKHTDKNQSGAVKLLLVWCIFPLIFLSISPSKRIRYLIPIFPAIALLLGWFWSQFLPERIKILGRGWRLLALILSVVLVVIALVIVFFHGFREILELQHIQFSQTSLLLISLLCFINAGIIIYYFVREPTPLRSYIVIFASMFILLVVKFGFINPATNVKYSPARLNALIEINNDSDEPVGVYDSIRESYQIYGDYFLRKIRNADEIKEFASGGIEPRLFLIRYKHWKEKRDRFFTLFRQLQLRPVGQASLDEDLFLLFQTQPQKIVQPAIKTEPSALTFVVVGDTRSGDSPVYKIGEQILRLHQQSPIDGIIMVGDNLKPQHSFHRDVLQNFVKPFRNVIRAGIPFFACLGNHDEKYAEDEIQFPLFNMKGRRYYSQTFGNNEVEFFFLDTNTLKNDEEQLQWLKRSLNNSKAQWKIVVMHVPMYASSVSHGSSPELIKLLEPIFLEGNDVDLVLSGHNHFYERLYTIKGILYITVGGSGKLKKGKLKKTPIRAVGYNKKQAFLWFQIQGDRLILRAYSCDGEIVDKCVIKDNESPDKVTFTASPSTPKR